MFKQTAIVAMGTAALLNAMTTDVHAEPDQITIFTSVSGSSWYGIGAGMAEIFAQSGVPSNPELGAGLSNVANVASGQGELGFTMSPAITVARNGQAPFQEPVTNIAVIAALSESLMHIIANGERGITTVSDLTGRPFVTQPPGAITAVMFEEVLAAYGMNVDDIDMSQGSLTVQRDELRDRRSDGMVSVASFPSSWVQEIAATMPIDLVPVSDDAYQALHARMPTVGRAVIPAGSYEGQTDDVDTITATMIIVAAADMPEDDAYWITRALVENIDRVRGLHGSYADLTPAAMAEVPGGGLHPGAERYYREIGVLN